MPGTAGFGGLTGGDGWDFGSSASSGDLFNTQNNSFGGFNITAAPAWAGGVSSGGAASSGAGVDWNVVIIAGAGLLGVWLILNRKR